MSALGVPFALLIAVGNALWQSHLQSNKTRHDLFQKRFDVYESIGTLVHQILTKEAIQPADLSEITTHARAAEFLFKPPVVKYMDQLCVKANDLREMQAVQAQLRERGREPSESRQKDYRMIRDWFITAASLRARELFTPYLCLAR
jgi:hypothetical protein